MGLTVHYRIDSDAVDHAAARRQVEQMRSLAMDLPFDEVGEIIELKGKQANFEQPEFRRGGSREAYRWLAIQAVQYAPLPGDQETHVMVSPAELIAFETRPGLGCESANFGLCRYPARIMVARSSGRQQRLETGLGGRWQWGSFCKTQYASNPNHGGVANFLRCHISLVTLLDRIAARPGLRVECNDEGGYASTMSSADYEEARRAGREPTYALQDGHYSPRRLADEVGQWNETIAAVVGQFNDLAHSTGLQAESAITRFNNFEQLEFRGQEKAAEVGDFLNVLKSIAERSIAPAKRRT